MQMLERSRRRVVATVLGLAIALSNAAAQDIDADALLKLAEQGDLRAAFLLGSRFAARGGDDDAEAARWFKRAADGGLAEGQYNLGILYANGRGVRKDDARAAELFRQAAEQDLAEAQFNLASFYASGRGVPRDEAVAAGWFERAALEGLAPAQHNLGLMYEHGRGVPRDPQKAIAWYEKAASQGFSAASVRRDGLMAALAADASKNAPDAAPEKPAPANAAMTGEDWVTRQDPSRYTLQLASFLARGDAERLLARVGEPEAGIYAAHKKGKRWYSVVAGAYQDAAAAKAAAAALAARMKLEPWMRRFATIHAEIRAR